MRVSKLIAVFVLELFCLLTWSSHAQESPTEPFVFREMWRAADPRVPGNYAYADNAEGACRAGYIIGPASLYYKGEYYTGQKPYGTGSSNAWPGQIVTCVSFCTASTCLGAIEATTPAALVCMKEEQATGTKTFIRSGNCPCEYGCPGSGSSDGGGSTVQLNNPVELPALSKVTQDRDWSAPGEPRFAIVRNYRSDDLLLRRYEGSLNSELDMFAGVWQFGYNDTIDVNQDNPYDPQDTQNYKRFDSSNGGSVHFLQSDPTQILGHGYGFTYTDLGSTGRLNNGRGEVRDFRELLAHTPYPMISLTWSDGYKITFTRDSTTDRLTRMSDNRSNVAD